MAVVTRSASASPETFSIMHLSPIMGIAGEDIPAGAPCYIKGADGKIYKADGTAANEKARLAGFSPKQVYAGFPVECFGIGAKFHYSDSDLTPGALLYIAATAGELDTAATTGDAVGVAQVLPDKRSIRITRGV